VLAQVKLPEVVGHTQQQYVLHPSVMDSALHAALGLKEAGELGGGAGEPMKPALPFALESLRIISPCNREMFAWVRYSPDSKPSGNLVKLDVDLCDAQGQVCVCMKGVAFRPLEGELGEASRRLDVQQKALPVEREDESAELLTLAPVWEAVREEAGEAPAVGERVVVITGAEEKQRELLQECEDVEVLQVDPGATVEEISELLRAGERIDHVVWILPVARERAASGEGFIDEQEQGAILGFRLIKALLREGYGARQLRWTVITNQTQKITNTLEEKIDPAHSGVHGLVGSMAKEYGRWKVRLVDLGRGVWPWKEIMRLGWHERGEALAHREGQWYRRRLLECELGERRDQQATHADKRQCRYRRGGVYVLIGGAGGLGGVLSEYLIREYEAQVVWIGRRAKDEAIEKKQEQVAARAGKSSLHPLYIAADARKREDLERACKEIKERYGRINGVIHSAVVLADKSLANMEEEQFRAGLSAKVDVAVRLAQAFGEEPLDFVLYFSSVQSFAKLPGQSNYAAGCTFADAFAEWQRGQVEHAVKVMNWGYWGSVGIVASVEYQERMAQLGIASIEPQEGVAALERLLCASRAQVAMIRAKKEAAADLLGIKTGERMWTGAEQAPSVCERMGEEVSAAVENESVAEQMSRWQRQRRVIDAALAKMLYGQMRRLGLNHEEMRTANAAEWKKKAGISESYDRWMRETLRILDSRGYLQGGRETAGDDQLWAEWESEKGRLRQEEQNLTAQLNLVDTTLRSLAAILRGEKRATDVIFPNCSLKLVEGVYKHPPIADYFNGVMAESVRWYVEKRTRTEAKAKLRLLELGAGTGGSSAGVLRKLDAFRDNVQEYCYTDLCKAFLLHGQQAYGAGRDYLRYAIVDVEKDLAEQGVECGVYDVVLAANVLHATRLMRNTLRNAKAALKENGILVLNELAVNSVYAHLTFGLLEGWWAHEDAELRMEGSPGLTSASWTRLLGEEGFRHISFPAHQAHELGLQIIVAENAGVIRERYPVMNPHNKAAAQPALPPAGEVISPTEVGSRRGNASFPGVPVQAPATTASEKILREKSVVFLKSLVGQTLRVYPDLIDATEPLGNYGLDSILVLQLTNDLRGVFGDIDSTLIFEYQSIDALVDHFLVTEREALWKLCHLENEGNSNYSSLEPRDTSTSPSLAARSSPEERQGARRRSRRLYPAKSNRNETAYPGGEIAIIAMSGRFPKARTVEEYWENLKAGVDCVTEIPQKRWNCSSGLGDGNGQFNKNQCRWGGFIEGIDEFDPLFFGIAPRGAELIDPQERLFLETVWNLLESAGYTRKRIQREDSRVGVYVGSTHQQYNLLRSDLDSECATAIFSSGGIANRASHFFGLCGPSIAVNTMCSSSSIAIHLACKDLLQGECRLAIVGGVNLSLHPKKYIGLGLARLTGSDAQRRSFADGDGYLPAEAVGAVLLKPLDRAIEDGDTILAVIKGSATNHNGQSYSYGVPSLHAETQVIENCLRTARIDPRTISYVEAAAGGSRLGDAIEVTALSKAFGKLTADRQFCAIGTMRSNIGHPEACSGIAQLIKVVLQLQHAQLPPTIKAIPLNPDINFGETPFYLQQQVADWKRPRIKFAAKEQEFPRRALINSFGGGGSNASVIIEEYMAPEAIPNLAGKPVERAELLIFSAKNADRLRTLLQQVVQYMKDNESISIAELAYTLQLGREEMDSRLAVVGNDRKELIHALELYLSPAPESNHLPTPVPLYAGTVTKDPSRIKELTKGEVGNSMIRLVVAERDLNKLALMWTQGVEIPWEQLYQGRKLHMLRLPTYPFERERYWLPNVEKGIPEWVACLDVPAHGVSADNESTQDDEFALSRREVNVAKRVPNVQSASTQLPRTDLERMIAKVWEEVLGVTGIGITDNFLDLGGTSLQGEQVIVRLRELFHVELQMDAFLGAQTTITAIAVRIVSELAKLEGNAALERHFESVSQPV
jgi:polyketide synthase PksM